MCAAGREGENRRKKTRKEGKKEGREEGRKHVSFPLSTSFENQMNNNSTGQVNIYSYLFINYKLS